MCQKKTDLLQRLNETVVSTESFFNIMKKQEVIFIIKTMIMKATQKKLKKKRVMFTYF